MKVMAAACVLLAGSVVGVSLPVAARAAAPVRDYTFHVTLTPPATPLDAWQLSAAPATPVHRPGGPEIVDANAAGVVATVSAWTPGANYLDLGLNFSNIGKAGATSTTLVVDMISPAWDATIDPTGGYVAGTSTVNSNGFMFNEHFPTGPLAAGSSMTVPLRIGIGSPGTLPAARYELFYHVETGSGATLVRHGLPYEGTLPRVMAKVLPPAAGQRYLVLDGIDPSSPLDRWPDRFAAKYNLHPAVYEFIGSDHKMDNQPISSYITSIQTAAARGMVPAVQLGIGGPADPGNWTYQDIINGVHDAFITQLATAIRDLGYPVIGFLGEEFNKASDRVDSSCGSSGTSSCSTNSTYTASDADAYGSDPNCNDGPTPCPDGPERFREAEKHVVDLFDQVGASNVTYIIMTNDATYDTPGFQWDSSGATDAWWDEAKNYYLGPDYVDILGTQVYNSYPNPGGAVFNYPTIQQDYARHHNGYYDWTALDPNAMFALPDDVQTYGTYPATSKDRSPLINAWYQNMANFPAARYFGLYDNGADNGICATAGPFCLSNPPSFTATGIGDYGFFQPNEIDTLRAGEQAAGFTGTPVLSADVTPPAAVSDLTAVPGSSPGSIVLSWTAPGNDGFTGTADHYTLKYRTDTNLSAATWSRWDTQFAPPPAPVLGGTKQTYTLSGVAAGTYTFSIKATDPAHHNAPVGNTATVTIASGAAGPVRGAAAAASATRGGTPINRGASVRLAAADAAAQRGVLTGALGAAGAMLSAVIIGTLRRARRRRQMER